MTKVQFICLRYTSLVIFLWKLLFWELLTTESVNRIILRKFKSHFALFSWSQLPLYLDLSHWRAVSFLSLSSGIWVGAADMLSEVSTPHGDTHHYHHHLPLPPSLSVCLALSLAACCPQLMERQSHCWLITQDEGEQYSPVSQGGTAVVASCQSGSSEPPEGALESRHRGKKLEGDKHKGDNNF